MGMKALRNDEQSGDIPLFSSPVLPFPKFLKEKNR
jgi:hypothetical protein